MDPQKRRGACFDRRKKVRKRTHKLLGGIARRTFLRYKKWATPSGYLCGTYAAAVLLAYYQDYREEWMLPLEIRKKNTSNLMALTKALRSQIQPLGLPTIPFQVSTGISSF